MSTISKRSFAGMSKLDMYDDAVSQLLVTKNIKNQITLPSSMTQMQSFETSPDQVVQVCVKAATVFLRADVQQEQQLIGEQPQLCIQMNNARGYYNKGGQQTEIIGLLEAQTNVNQYDQIVQYTLYDKLTCNVYGYTQQFDLTVGKMNNKGNFEALVSPQNLMMDAHMIIQLYKNNEQEI